MKKELFYELLGDMDEEAIKAAETVPVKKPKWIGYVVSAAACIGLIVGIGIMYNHSINPVSNSTNDYSLAFEEIKTEEQLYNYLKDEIARNPESIFAQNVRRDQLIPIYSLETPQDYALSYIDTADHGEYITMHYRNAQDDAQQITFVWGYKTLGDKYLNDAIEMLGLTEIPGMNGYYYVGAANDSGTQIYQIYWSEDGYYMQANVPVVIFGQIDDGNHEASYMSLTLRKDIRPFT